jgi:hypothetical protein
VQEADSRSGPLVEIGHPLTFTESGKHSITGEQKTVTVSLVDGAALNFVEALTF